MTRLVEWLLGLDGIRLGTDAPLLIKWGAAMPAWMLLGLGTAAVLAVVAVYSREGTSRARRAGLVFIRLSLIGVVVAAICQPILVLQRDRIDRSYVSLVVDTSMSMATRDAATDASPDSAEREAAAPPSDSVSNDLSRCESITAALTRDQGAPLRRLLQNNSLQLTTFAGVAENRAWCKTPAVLDEFIERLREATPEGTSTDLAGAISRVIEDARGRRLAAIILASDGQSTEASSLKDALDAARGQQVPVFALRVGSSKRPRDVSLGRIRAQESVFKKDFVSVSVPLSGTGLSSDATVTVQMIDVATGEVVAVGDAVLTPERSAVTVELIAKPEASGRVRYRIDALPIAGERRTDNNTADFEVAIVEDRLRVLFVAGYPRYEYRYLKNALLREETVELSVLLLEADEAFVQEGTDPIRRFPSTPEELNRFDVVLFGDVDPQAGWLSTAQIEMLLDFVGDHGGGFGLIAGERAAPHRYLNCPLQKLVPVKLDPSFFGPGAGAPASGFRPVLTADGAQSRLFATTQGTPADSNGAVRGDLVLESRPELFWIARTLGAKPGATVLAHHPFLQFVDDRHGSGQPMPVVVLGRYGAGKVFFQATDDTWRWRRHTGELAHDTYWVQVVRGLMRTDRVSQGHRFTIHTDRRHYPYGMPVQIRISVFDPDLLTENPETIEVMALTESGGEAAQNAEADDDAAGAVVGRLDARRLDSEENVFEAVYLPPYPGRFLFEAGGLAFRDTERAVSAPVQVEEPDLEGRQPEANHEVLRRIADATGGAVIELDQLKEAFGAIPDGSVKIPDDVTEPLWDSRLLLGLFVLLISMEWGLRKAFGLM